MAGSSWQRVGEGFAGIDRRSSSNGGSKDEHLHRQPKQSQRVATSKGKVSDFVPSFSVQPRQESNNSPDDEVIAWSDSSSEEDVKPRGDKGQTVTPYANNRKRRGQRNPRLRTGRNKRFAAAEFVSPFTAAQKGGLSDNTWATQEASLDSESLNVAKKNKNCNSSFEGIVGFDSPQPCNKHEQDHIVSNSLSAKHFDDIDIDDSASSSNEDVVDDNMVKESDVEDIASDEYEDSVQPQKPCRHRCRSDSSEKASPVLTLSQEKESQQVEISSVTSSLGTASPSTNQNQRLGASDWAVRFQQEVSPDSKSKAAAEPVNHPDSAKKKQRFSSKSLAGQLSRLIKREKSSIRFWQHSSSKETWNAGGSQKCVTLEVLSMAKQYSLYVLQCRVIADKSLLLVPARNCQLMLVKDHADQISIQVGNTIELFPPWKQMGEGEKIVILCANQVRVIALVIESDCDRLLAPVSSTSDDCRGVTTGARQNAAKPKNEEGKVSFRWTCPCKDNGSIPSSKCPAYKSDHFIKFFSKVALREEPPSSVKLSNVYNLHSVQSSTPPRPMPAVQRTLLQSIQDERVDKEGSDCMPPFEATILRVFRQNDASQSQNAFCLSMLVEDSSGTVALVQLEDMERASCNALWVKLYNSMGTECVCHSLSLVTRRTKEKDPSLFQVIAQAWRVGKLPSMDSQDDSQTSQVAQKIPGFCYILQCVADPSCCIQSLGMEGKQPALDLTNLQQIVMDKNSQQRFSCVARVIDVQSSELKGGLFVCDTSSHSHAGAVTTFHPLSVSRTCVAVEITDDRKCRECLLQDVIWNGDRIHADEYSTILLRSTWSKLGVENLVGEKSLLENASLSRPITAPVLAHSSPEDYFVRVSGHIVHVDEDKCYSWDGCGGCGHQLVVADEDVDERFPFCPVCRKYVSHSLIRMSMEVNILEDFSKDWTVTINLSQSTISSLLPQEEVPDEGFDVGRVLGKPISVLGFVVGRTDHAIHLYQVDL